MRLTRLEIHRLPGIDAAFTLTDLAPGINVVTGPNASGKSSIVRALRLLLAPRAQEDPSGVDLAADFSGAAPWRVVRTGSGITWRRDGAASPPPRLPTGDRLDCWWLGVDALLAADAGQGVLVAELQRLLAGGFDFPRLRDELFPAQPQTGRREVRELQTATAHLLQVERAHEALRRQEDALGALDERIHAAERATGRAAQITHALQLGAVRAEISRLRGELARFPAFMEQLRGDECERLEQLRTQLQQTETEAAGCRHRIEVGEQVQARAGFGRDIPAAADIAQQQRCLDRARDRGERAAEARARLREAVATRDLARASLGDADVPPRLDPAAVSRADELADAMEALRQEERELEAQILTLTAAPEPDAVWRVEEGAGLLQRWQARREALAPAPWTTLLVLLGALALGGGAAWAALALQPWAWAGVAAALLLLVAAVVQLGQRRHWRRELAQLRDEFTALGLAQPDDWDEPAVRAERRQLEAAIHRLKRQRAESVRRDELDVQLEQLAPRRAALEQERGALTRAYGFDPQLTARGASRFLTLARSWSTAAQQCAVLAQQAADLDGEAAAARAEVQAFLAARGIPVAARDEALVSALQQLDARREEAQRARDTVHAGRLELVRLDRAAAAARRDIAAIMTRLGLPADGEAELRNASDMLGAWRVLRDALRGKEGHEQGLRQDAKMVPELLRRVEAGAIEALHADLAAAEAAGSELVALREERSKVQLRVTDARSGTTLADANAAAMAARDALEDVLDAQLLAAAGRALLDQVRDEFRSEHEPAVLQDARARLRRFTRHQWDFQVGDDGLVARDLTQKEDRQLDELSSGTRMQLLIAVRLAWARQLERDHEALPVILDEALTTTDERRFRAVAQSLASLADAEERQIFYLTARRDDLGLWTDVLGRAPHHVDLAAIRGRPAAGDASAYRPPPRPVVPAPAGLDAATWAARLGVPPLDPRQKVASWHAFHLLRDEPELLHRLLDEWHVEYLGQLEALAESAAGAAVLGAARSRLRARLRIAAAWRAAWQQGRAPVVDRIALERSGAVSDTFIDEVSALAAELDGAAAALIAALREGHVKRFRSDKTDELETWLREHGHLTAATPLDAPDRARTVLRQLGAELPPELINQTIRWLETGTRTA